MLGKLRRITSDKDAIDGDTLRALYGIPVLDMPCMIIVQLGTLSVIKSDGERIVLSDSLHGGEVPGTDMGIAI